MPALIPDVRIRPRPILHPSRRRLVVVKAVAQTRRSARSGSAAKASAASWVSCWRLPIVAAMPVRVEPESGGDTSLFSGAATLSGHVTVRITRGISRRTCQSARDKSHQSLEAPSGHRPPGLFTQTAAVVRAAGTCSRVMAGRAGAQSTGEMQSCGALPLKCSHKKRAGIGDQAAAWNLSDQSRVARRSPFADTMSALTLYGARSGVAGSPVSMTALGSASAIMHDGARTVAPWIPHAGARVAGSMISGSSASDDSMGSTRPPLKASAKFSRSIRQSTRAGWRGSRM